MALSLKEKIINLRKKGKSYRDICLTLDCAQSTVSYHCKKVGLDIPVSHSSLNDTEVKTINKLYSQGLSIAEICRQTGRSKRPVNKSIIEKRERTKPISRSQSVISWRQRRKKELVDYKGGKCFLCGYKKCISSLDFHHKNPEEKEFGIGGKSWSVDRLKKEADKCVVVCKNCHGEIHAGIRKI